LVEEVLVTFVAPFVVVFVVVVFLFLAEVVVVVAVLFVVATLAAMTSRECYSGNSSYWRVAEIINTAKKIRSFK
jgi:ABC-type protease/lipase transport system fused ATPase/permease subunit